MLSCGNTNGMWPARPATHGSVMSSPVGQCPMIRISIWIFCKLFPRSVCLVTGSALRTETPGSDHCQWVGGQREREGWYGPRSNLSKHTQRHLHWPCGCVGPNVTTINGQVTLTLQHEATRAMLLGDSQFDNDNKNEMTNEEFGLGTSLWHSWYSDSDY